MSVTLNQLRYSESTVYQSGMDFQHNVGYWATPAPNLLDHR